MVFVIVELDEPFSGPRADLLLAEAIHFLGHLRVFVLMYLHVCRLGVICSLGHLLIDLVWTSGSGPYVFDVIVKILCIDNRSDGSCHEQERHYHAGKDTAATLFLVNAEILP